jgi:hypothetical protein
MLDNNENALSVEEYAAIEILREAASISAEEVRFTAYRPANEVSIRYKLPTHNGRQKFVNQPVETYRKGASIVRTLLADLCGCTNEEPESLFAFSADVLPEKALLIGVESAEVRLRAIGAANPTGFIAIVAFTYPRAREGVVVPIRTTGGMVDATAPDDR